MPSYPMFAGYSFYLPTKGWKAESTLARYSWEWVLNPGLLAWRSTALPTELSQCYTYFICILYYIYFIFIFIYNIQLNPQNINLNLNYFHFFYLLILSWANPITAIFYMFTCSRVISSFGSYFLSFFMSEFLSNFHFSLLSSLLIYIKLSGIIW